MSLNRPVDLMGKKDPQLSRRREPILPHCFCTMCGGLVWQGYARVHTCAAAVQYWFVRVRRGFGYPQPPTHYPRTERFLTK